MPGSLKRALVREVARRGSNLNDVAVSLLAERFGVAFTPSGRRRKAIPGAAGAVVLRMPPELRRELKASARRRSLNVNDLVLLTLSEALAVRWRDLDLDTGRLTVAAQLDRAGQTVPLKTTASGATVDLLPALVRELRAHRARRAALGIHLVRADALAFSTRTGKPHHQRSALRAIQTAAVDAELGHVTADKRLSASTCRRRSRKSSLGEHVEASDVVVTMGCGDACPVYPGKRYEDWALPDPAGKGPDEVRQVRDVIDERVRALLTDLFRP